MWIAPPLHGTEKVLSPRVGGETPGVISLPRLKTKIATLSPFRRFVGQLAVTIPRGYFLPRFPGGTATLGRPLVLIFIPIVASELRV